MVSRHIKIFVIQDTSLGIGDLPLLGPRFYRKPISKETRGNRVPRFPHC